MWSGPPSRAVAANFLAISSNPRTGRHELTVEDESISAQLSPTEQCVCNESRLDSVDYPHIILISVFNYNLENNLTRTSSSDHFVWTDLKGGKWRVANNNRSFTG